jgi:queuine tRNA-ribosyltransferase
MLRSIRWLDRCLVAHKNRSRQNLFAIIQGGLNEELRRRCVAEMIKRDVPGFAIGGLSGGESKDEFWRMVHITAPLLPTNKPRYVMGIGYAEDLVVCTALGCDMYDCVFPTRTARFGTALTFAGPLNLKQAQYEADFGPLDSACGCQVCKRYTRAFLHRGASKTPEIGQLLSFHNLYFQKDLMTQQRQAIIAGTYDQWVSQFLVRRYKSLQQVPEWINDALKAAEIEIK